MTQAARERHAYLLREAGTHHGAGRFVEALHLYLLALELAPGEPGTLLDIGACLHDLGRFEEALFAYGEALAVNPRYAPGYNNRGNAYLELGRYEDSARDYLKALELMPEHPELYVALATSLQALGRHDDAKLCCEKALQLNPDLAEAHWNLALVLLLEGDYDRGWREFEWRWRKKGFTSWQRQFDRPLWDGSPLSGRTILLHAEQGFGDALQFARYLPLVAARGGEVIVECHRELVSLFARIEGVRVALPFGSVLPPFEVHAPFMSLPRLFGTSLDTIPGRVPYLAAEPERAEIWRQRLAQHQGLKVGVVWAGNATQKNDRERSLPFAALDPLWSVPVHFFSLQIGEANRAFGQSAASNRHDLTRHIKDFDDTAAFIAGLDLVVCVCTSVAHLAAGMGKPVFLMVAQAADWRWLKERADSPWYPSLQIFRQKRRGDWLGVVHTVKRHLEEITRQRPGVPPDWDLAGCR
jgi:Flp pilus assembly protein TadD